MGHILPPALPHRLPPGRSIGITTTVPIEVLLAADLVPVDLNNLFITSDDPRELAAEAEKAGFPRTCCCWTKGLYGAVHHSGVERVMGVLRGDCSNAAALLEVLRSEGGKCLTFDYPAEPDPDAMQRALEDLAERLGADPARAERIRRDLAPIREIAHQIDRLSWMQGTVHGLENHLWLVSASDFCAGPARYRKAAEEFLNAVGRRAPIGHDLRLGLCGVPPIIPELYDFLESQGALVAYNETQRQFAMPGGGGSLAEQYTRYTYPYSVFGRIGDIRTECERRGLDGLIHYVQSFCHRRIEDRIIRRRLSVPILTLEADRPGPLSGQLRTRLEAFVQMLRARKSGRRIL